MSVKEFMRYYTNEFWEIHKKKNNVIDLNSKNIFMTDKKTIIPYYHSCELDECD